LSDFIQTNLAIRCKTGEQFKAWFAPAKFTDATLKQHAERVAHNLASEGRPIFIAFSGGLDSEFILQTFISAGLDIIPIIVDSPFNQPEVAYAYKLCAENNITPVVISYTSVQQFVLAVYNIAKTHNLNSLIGCVTMLAADYATAHSGNLLTGHGDPFIMNTTYTDIRTVNPDTIPTLLKFSDHDYYVETFYPLLTGSFIGSDTGLFYSMLCEISHILPYEEAKASLYGISLRNKNSWNVEFYKLNAQLLYNDYSCEYLIPKKYLMSYLETYKT
jgi:hypothetical protein